MLQEITDFHEEGRSCAACWRRCSEADWQRKTLFKDWTVNDVVLHLHCSDISAAASVRDAAEYEKLRGRNRRAAQGRQVDDRRNRASVFPI